MQNHPIACLCSSALLALAVAGSSSLIGCASSQRSGDAAVAPTPAADAAQPASNDPLAPMRAMGYRLDWRGYTILQAGAKPRTVTPLGTAIVAQDSRNVITLLEPDTGAIRWADAEPNELDTYRGHFLRGEELVSVTQSEVTLRDIRNGVLRERQRLGVLANTDVLFVDPMIVYGSTIGEAVGHHLRTGFKFWGNQLDSTIRVKPVLSANGRAVFVSNRGQVLSIDVDSGRAELARNRAFEGADVPPVADAQRAYVASRDHSVWAFDLFDGSQKWRYRTEVPLRSPMALHDGSLYLHVPGQGMTALEAKSGARRWANPAVEGEVVGVRRGRLLVWDRSSKTLHSVLATNGSVVESQSFADARFLSVEGFEEPNLYVVYDDGAIDRFVPR